MLKVILLILIFVFVCYAKIRREPVMDRCEFCKHSDPPTFRVELNNQRTSFSALVEVLRELDSNRIKLVINIKRCNSREAPDTCFDYGDYKVPNACVFINLKGVAWETVFQNVKPPLRCPFQKTTYRVDNATLETDLFNMFSLDNYYWKVTINIFEKNTLIGAACMEGEIIKKYY